MKDISNIVEWAGISTVFALVRTLLVPDRRTFLGVLTSLLAGVVVGIVVGFTATDFGLSNGVIFALVAGVSIIAENIIWTIINFGKVLEQKGHNFLWSLFTKGANKNDISNSD